MGNGLRSEREAGTPRRFNSPLKFGPEHGDYLVGRPKRTPAQMRWNDRIVGVELLGWIGASVAFSGGQIAVSGPQG